MLSAVRFIRHIYSRFVSWYRLGAVNAVILICSSMAGLVLLETGIRIALPQYNPRGRIEFVCQNGLFLAPRSAVLRQWTATGDFDVTIETNRYGFRDPKNLCTSDTSSIFVVGDSFGFGHGVREEARFSSVLQRHIGKPVYNICIPGDLDSYDRLIEYSERQGATIGTLIVAVCMENDLASYDKPSCPCRQGAIHEYRRPIDLLRRPWAIGFHDIKTLLAAHSAVYGAVAGVVHCNRRFASAAKRLGLMHGEVQFLGEREYDAALIDGSVHRILRLTRKRRSIVLLIPARGLWGGENQEVEACIHDSLVTALKAAAVEVVDLRPLMELAGDPFSFHFPRDGHWNESGHALAAKALAAHPVLAHLKR